MTLKGSRGLGQVQAEQAAAHVEGAQDGFVEKADGEAGLLEVLGGGGSFGGAAAVPVQVFLICCIADFSIGSAGTVPRGEGNPVQI